MQQNKRLQCIPSCKDQMFHSFKLSQVPGPISQTPSHQAAGSKRHLSLHLAARPMVVAHLLVDKAIDEGVVGRDDFTVVDRRFHCFHSRSGIVA
jgi:hypothetical protein